MNQKENIIRDKSYAFALRIIKLYKYLVETKQEYILSKQILREGTSVGAKVEEALGGHSKKISSRKYKLLIKKQEKFIIGYAC